MNGEDKRAANLAIAETLVEAVRGALAAQPDPAVAQAAAKAQDVYKRQVPSCVMCCRPESV